MYKKICVAWGASEKDVIGAPRSVEISVLEACRTSTKILKTAEVSYQHPEVALIWLGFWSSLDPIPK